MNNIAPVLRVNGRRIVLAALLFVLPLAAYRMLHADDAPAAKPAAPAAATPAAAAAAAPAKVKGGPALPEEMQGVDWTGLTPAQKDLAVKVMNENSCDCGCGMKVGGCRRDDPKCPRSPTLAKQVVDLAKAGKGKDEIVKTVLTPPTKYVQFALDAGKSPSVGPADAKVTLIHYFDYQCPFCTRIVPTLDEIAQAYPKDVRVVYKMHPLSMHPNAVPAAHAALAANAQGKFFEMDKKLFENQRDLTRDRFIAIAKEIGLDVDKFTKDIDGKVYAAQIDQETKEAESIGSMGTPATFVNGRYVSGAKPFAFFKDMIDEELGWAKAGNRPDFKIGKNVSETQAKTASTGPDPNKVYPLAAGKAPGIGAAKPKVTLLHYFDYQCPFCVRMAPTLEKLAADYPNDVRVVFKMHPLPMHQNAMIAAESAMAAHAQGKFHEMNAELLKNSSALSRDKIMEIAKNIGLDVPKFTKSIDSHEFKSLIDAETQEVMSIGATGTPATFVNGRFVNGAAPYDSFKKLIDEELAKSSTASAATAGTK
jgi:protein-disulfide isomerase